MQKSARLTKSQILVIQGWIFTFNFLLGGIAQAQNITSFNPDLNGTVQSLVIQTDGKLLAGGFFTQIGTQQPQPYQHLVRINPDGTADASFNNPRADDVVFALALQSDGKILVGGQFYHIGSGVSYARRALLARLNADGTLDTSFTPPEISGSSVAAIALQPNGQVLVGGNFFLLDGSPCRNLARLNTDGTWDTSFGNLGDPVANNAVNTLAIQPNGQILVGGEFTQIGSDTPPPPIRNRIARLNANGTLDATFGDVGDTEGPVNAIALQADGKVVIGGDFDMTNGNRQNFLARLNSDGGSDASYMNAQTDLTVSALALQPDGKLVAGGSFTSIGPFMGNTQSRQGIVRLHPNGLLDISFPDLGANFNVNAIAIGRDNRLFVGGAFTSIGSQGRNHLAQLDNDAIFKDNFETN